jgi:hypothetical protein
LASEGTTYSANFYAQLTLNFLEQFCERRNEKEFYPLSSQASLESLKTDTPLCLHRDLRGDERFADIKLEKAEEHKLYSFYTNTYFSPCRLATLAYDPQNVMEMDCNAEFIQEFFKQFDFNEFVQEIKKDWLEMMTVAQELMFSTLPHGSRPQLMNYFTGHYMGE